MTGRTVIQLRQGREILEIEGRSVVLGRGGRCDVQLDDTGVSRRHCEVILDNLGLVVRDLGSRHGTWVDGKRIEAETRVHAGQVLSMGSRGPRFQVAGALLNGYPMAGAAGAPPPRRQGGRPAPTAATAPARGRARGLTAGLVTGVVVAVLAGLGVLAFVDLADPVASARDRMGAHPVFSFRPAPRDAR